MSTLSENVARNPVGRLHAILEDVPQTAAKMGEWLVSHFEVEETDIATQIELYADLAHLVVASRNTVDEISGFEEDDKEEFRQHIDVVANAIAASNTQTPCHQFDARIPTSTMTGLRMYSRFLTRAMPEKTLENGVIEDLLNQTHELFEALLDTNLDSELKGILLEHLSSIERALRLYALSGSVGLRRAADGLAGSVLFGYYKHPDDDSQNWLKRCGSLAASIASFTGFAANARKALPEFFDNLPNLPIGQ